MNLVDSKSTFNEDKAPTRADYVKKREIDRSTLYSFDGPFQLLHADVGNLEFLGKNATFPQYVLVIVDLFSSKIYTYSMKSRKQILQNLKLFYNDIRYKRKGKRMRLQVDNEFQQVKIKDLNDESNVEMFTSSVRGGKEFPKETERRSLSGQCFTTIFNMHRIEKTQKFHRRLDDDDYSAKKRKLRDELFIGEKVYVFAERIKQKRAPGKFYKQSVQNISYFNKEKTFIIRAIQSIGGIKYYWQKNSETNRKIAKRFMKTELFALKSNFSV